MQNNYTAGTCDTRPWGKWRVIETGNGFVVKEITVNPNGILSLQRHQHRSEHWIITHGIGTITLDDSVVELHRDQNIYLPKQSWHRIENRTNDTLVFIEVQLGDILDESDIERREDKYGR